MVDCCVEPDETLKIKLALFEALYTSILFTIFFNPFIVWFVVKSIYLPSLHPFVVIC